MKKHMALTLATTLTLFGASEVHVNAIEKKVAQLEKKVNRLQANSTWVGVDDPYVNTVTHLYGDVLYWYAQEDGLAYAVRAQTDAQGSTLPTEVQYPDFRFQVGFRVGLGFNTMHDNWNIDASWLNYKNTAQDSTLLAAVSFNTGTDSLLNGSSAEYDVTYGNFAYGKMYLNMNIADLAFRKPYWVGQYTLLQTRFGIRGSRIDSDFTVHSYQQNANAASTLDTRVVFSQNQKGIGLLAGVDSTMYIDEYISLFGTLGTSVLFTENDVKKSQTLTIVQDSQTRDTSSSAKIYSSMPTIDLSGGIQLESWPMAQTFRVALLLGWEMHTFIGYNRFVQYLNPSSLGTISDSNGSLSTLGGFGRLAIDF